MELKLNFTSAASLPFAEDKEVDDATLWAIISDLTEVLAKYKPTSVFELPNDAFMFWYELYQEIQKELDKRIMQGR